MTGAVKPDAERCLDTAHCLRGTTVDVSPGERWTRSITAVTRGLENVRAPWAHVMPRRAHAAFVKKTVNSVVGATDRVTLDYLTGSWNQGGRVLGRLHRACVDEALLARLLREERSDSVTAALRSFVPPDHSGCAARVVYDRLATATGRLVVRAGPQILTVRKDLRRVLRSRYGRQGLVCALDFAGLEARIVLHEAGRGCDEPDVYGAIARDDLHGAFPRDAVKTAVLSRMYGAGRAMVAQCLGGSDPRMVDALIVRVGELFEFDALGARLRLEREANGLLRNKHGRPLLLDGHDDPPDSLLVSHWAQSTGVEVSLQGFSQLVIDLEHDGLSAMPLLVLHDALLFDTHRDDVEALQRPRLLSVPGHAHAFPVRFEVVSDTQGA